jgi:hypothetical protein
MGVALSIKKAIASVDEREEDQGFNRQLIN